MRDYAAVLEALHLDLMFVPTGPMCSDWTLKQVRGHMLRNSFFKKLSPKRKPTPEQTAKAIEKFKSVNGNLPEQFEFIPESELESAFYDYFCDHVNQALQTSSVDGIDYDDLLAGMTPGPGSSQKADSATLHTKLFESSMSYTNEGLISLYRTALSNSGSWAEAEWLRFQEFGFVRVAGGKLFFVLKNVDEARTCCTEALANQLVQQGIRHFLEERLLDYFGICLSTQPAKNRRLAWQGSRDGRSATLDLSSASDSNGFSLFTTVVRDSRIKRWIGLARSEVAVLPNGDIEKLRMVSTMGSGFTFPLMTILLASAVKAVVDLMDPDAEWSVFGDDIVVPTKGAPFLIRMLKKLGYLVNDDKSFTSGPFRESCGHDYYNGDYVRGVYVKSLETPADVYSAFNRLTRWAAYSDIPLDHTLRILRSMAHDFRVPPAEDDLAGFKVPFSCTKPRLTNEYWFKYRHLRRKARELVIEDADPGGDGLKLSFLSAAILGVYKHTWERVREPADWAPHTRLIGRPPGRLRAFIRDDPDAPPRMKIASSSTPHWNYYPPESEPGEQWLPDGIPKNPSRWDLDFWRSRLRETPQIWEDLLVGTFSR